MSGEHRVSKTNVTAAIGKARNAIVSVALFSGVINVLVLTTSLYMLQVYDRVLPSRSVPTLIGLTILIVLLYAALGALDFARIRVLSRIGLGIDRQLRSHVMQAVLHIPMRTKEGTDSTLPMRDLDQIRTFLSGLGPTALFDLPWLPIYVALIYALHPMLGVFAIVSASLLVGLAALTEFKTGSVSKAATENSSRRIVLGETVHRNAEVIQAMGLGRRVVGRWGALNERYLADQISLSDAASSIGSLSKVLRLLSQSGILGLGAYLAIRGELSPGALIAASIVLARALAPVESAIGNWKGFVRTRQSIRRLDALLSEVATDQLPITALPRPGRALEVRDLSIAPPGETLPVIRNVTFALEAGDGLGVIGPSAAGKSTLVRALVGVWKPIPRGGSVRLDGATLDQWSPASIGPAIGYLPQDIELFDGTIAENIARLDPDAPSSAIIAAAKLAGIHDAIVQLSSGYETGIGAGGMKLSAGLRQRVGLARALYGDPFLVVLDEPNSNLDSEGDLALTMAIRAVRMRGGIVIVVAHRPSALASVNKVLAMADGKVRVFGPRDEILKLVMQPMQNSSHGSPLATARAGSSLPQSTRPPRTRYAAQS